MAIEIASFSGLNCVFFYHYLVLTGFGRFFENFKESMEMV
jgi:hypothetical protein